MEKLQNATKSLRATFCQSPLCGNEMNTTSMIGIGLLLAIGLLICLYLVALPKPLSGIPYTRKSLFSPFGDAFDFVNYTKQTGEGFRWFATKSRELQSPIFQVFLGPFRKPIVVLADIQEIIDISSRRTKEFDRGGYLTEWVGILFPEGTISMPSHEKFKQQRNIWAVTMTTQFLNTVSAEIIHRHTCSLVALWKTKAAIAHGRPFEVSDDIKQVTFDMVRIDAQRQRYNWR